MLKKINQQKFVILVTVIAIFFLIAGVSGLFVSDVKEFLIEGYDKYPLIFFFVLTLTKFLGIVIPPIIVGPISLTTLPYTGWFVAFLSDSIADIFGSIVAYYITKKYGKRFIGQYVSLEKLEQWEAKLSEKQKLNNFILFRIFTWPVVDYTSYIAGLTNISFRTFFWGTVIGNTITSFIVHYLVGLGYEDGTITFVLTIGALTLVLGFIYRYYLKRNKLQDL